VIKGLSPSKIGLNWRSTIESLGQNCSHAPENPTKLHTLSCPSIH